MPSGKAIERPMVVGIGFPRTGTVSLAYALRELGYEAIHDYYTCRTWAESLLSGSVPAKMNAAHQNGGVAFLDGIWWKVAPLVRSRFPNAVLLHTTRDIESWAVSLQVLVAYLLAQGRPVDTQATIACWQDDFQHFNRLNREFFRGDPLYHVLPVGRTTYRSLADAIGMSSAPDKPWPKLHTTEWLWQQLSERGKEA